MKKVFDISATMSTLLFLQAYFQISNLDLGDIPDEFWLRLAGFTFVRVVVLESAVAMVVCCGCCWIPELGGAAGEK